MVRLHRLGSTTSPLWEEGTPQKFGSIGKKLPYAEMEMDIVDESGKPVVAGEIGELIARGPSIPAGFWRLPGKTQKDYRNGWFYTGDLSRRDEDGFYFLVERKDDMKKRGLASPDLGDALALTFAQPVHPQWQRREADLQPRILDQDHDYDFFHDL